MQQSFHYQPDESEKLLISLMDKSVTKELYDVLKLFRPQAYQQLDTDYKYTILAEQLPYFIPPEILEQENLICYLFRAKKKSGEMCRFILQLFFLGEAKFQCGVAWVPDSPHPLSLKQARN